MTFQVETGAGLADANAYVTVEFADAYFAARDRTEWSALSLVQKRAAIVAATDYIDLVFGSRLPTFAFATNQALAFPRADYKGLAQPLPAALQRACCEYAIRAGFNPLAPDVSADDTGQQILKKVESVGPINEETTYQSGANTASGSSRRIYPIPDGLMSTLLRRTGGGTVRS